jgi:hypothetical protein
MPFLARPHQRGDPINRYFVRNSHHFADGPAAPVRRSRCDSYRDCTGRVPEAGVKAEIFYVAWRLASSSQ